MIIKFESGFLGNQLFQYCGIKKYFPKHKLVFFGFSDLKSLCNIFDVFFINFNQDLLYNKLIRRLLFFLSDIKIIGKITETHCLNKYIINVHKGLFWNIFLAKELYFQHEKFVNRISSPPTIRLNHIKRAGQWIEKKNIFYKRYNLIFVHIRRGDYLFWPDVKYPAFIDLDSYKRNIERIKRKVKKPLFIIIGDDPLYLKKAFQESNELIISENSIELDFSIMTLCSHGVLSASSFSWWGAFYARDKRKENNIFLAPRYWAGHRIKKWIPLYFNTDWITYIEEN